MAKPIHVRLEPSEMAIFRSASDIFAAHVVAGNVKDGEEDHYIEKSISASLKICDIVEEKIISDTELG